MNAREVIQQALQNAERIAPHRHEIKPSGFARFSLKGRSEDMRKGMKEQDCGRAIIVAHNATFDHGFVMAAAERAGLKRNPFHPFATFDTAALSGLALGQTVLAKACQSANIPFDNKEAHSALYDTERTTELFCHIVNRWKSLGGWPLANPDETTDTEDEG